MLSVSLNAEPQIKMQSQKLSVAFWFCGEQQLNPALCPWPEQGCSACTSCSTPRPLPLCMDWPWNSPRADLHVSPIGQLCFCPLCMSLQATFIRVKASMSLWEPYQLQSCSISNPFFAASAQILILRQEFLKVSCFGIDLSAIFLLISR